MKLNNLLYSDCYYHIYNHAVSNNNLFISEENYTFFLKKYAYYIYPVARTYSFCLLPNHFHFLIGIRTNEALSMIDGINNYKNHQLFVSKQFSNLFSSYTQAFNKKYDRIGNLFIKNFKRKLIDNDKYFAQLIYYIHINPIHHGIVNDITDWKFSSYISIINNKVTKLEKEQVIKWFGSKKEFIDSHMKMISDDQIKEIEYL